MVKIAVPKETAAGEQRVALVPESVSRLAKAGVEVQIQSGAGAGANLSDATYEDAGAAVVDGDAAWDAEVVVKIQRPDLAEVAHLRSGGTLISLFQGADKQELEALRARDVTVLALERVPRITRAQSMDVLSSQSTVAGYKAALVGAEALDKFLPMLTTAAGSIAPAKVFVIGAGVAGLQAIATARRLGAVVSGFDIRPAAAEQVRSLGASFVGPDAISEEAETAGGYAREQAEDEQARTLSAIGAHLPSMDLVITTAQIPGRPAPRLITQEMITTMRPGSVIVDLAAETGGNCVLTQAGETVTAENGVQVIGPVNLPASVPLHASQMFSRNILTLLQHLVQDGQLRLDEEDEIVAAMRV